MLAAQQQRSPAGPAGRVWKEHEASPSHTGALGGAEAPVRAALRRVRLRAKRSAEPAEPARPGRGVTPAL